MMMNDNDGDDDSTMILEDERSEQTRGRVLIRDDHGQRNLVLILNSHVSSLTPLRYNSLSGVGGGREADLI